MTDIDLDAIEARAHLRPARGSDVRALVAEVRRLTALVNAKQSWIDGAKVDMAAMEEERAKALAAIALAGEEIERASVEVKRADRQRDDARAEVERTRASLGGMVEWLAEVIVDTRDALRVGGCTEHVLTAEQAGALEAATRILARERNADPSRYDLAIRERDDARAAIAAVRALCDHADSGLHAGLTMVSVAAVRGAILAALDVRDDPSATTGGAS